MLSIAITVCSLLLSVSQGTQNSVQSNISNFTSNKGICRACIFRSAEDFEKMKPMECRNVTISNKTATVEFTNLPDGTYAIFVFHDANANNQMDKNFLGIPKEGYGASGNKLPFAAAPKFSENKFSLLNNQKLQLNIRLRNL